MAKLGANAVAGEIYTIITPKLNEVAIRKVEKLMQDRLSKDFAELEQKQKKAQKKATSDMDSREDNRKTSFFDKILKITGAYSHFTSIIGEGLELLTQSASILKKMQDSSETVFEKNLKILDFTKRNSIDFGQFNSFIDAYKIDPEKLMPLFESFMSKQTEQGYYYNGSINERTGRTKWADFQEFIGNLGQGIVKPVNEKGETVAPLNTAQISEMLMSSFGNATEIDPEFITKLAQNMAGDPNKLNEMYSSQKNYYDNILKYLEEHKEKQNTLGYDTFNLNRMALGGFGSKNGVEDMYKAQLLELKTQTTKQSDNYKDGDFEKNQKRIIALEDAMNFIAKNVGSLVTAIQELIEVLKNPPKEKAITAGYDKALNEAKAEIKAGKGGDGVSAYYHSNHKEWRYVSGRTGKEYDRLKEARKG